MAKRRFFGTDGIRGASNKWPMTPDVALKVGMAVGVVFNKGAHRHRVVIGKDTRLSGYMIESALVSGFTSVGMDVVLLGPMPTPTVALMTRSLRADIGVMISASHNVFSDNGIKIFGGDGFKLSDQLESQIEALIDADLSAHLAAPDRIGRAKRIDGVADRYIEFAKSTLPRGVDLEGLRIVVDCANGAAYRVAPELLWELGAEVIKIGTQPDGLNINAGCGSTAPEALKNKVHEVRADVGVALDGDADRLILVDQRGEVINGDQLLAVTAHSWQEASRLSSPSIVATIMSNLGLERYLAGLGLSLARTKVGDRYVSEHMRAHGINVGGEQSGHIILSDFATTGDGLIAALQILAVIKAQGKPASEICHRFDPVPQILQNVRYGKGQPLADEAVISAVEAAKERLGNSGRLVIRPSGTEPLIRVMGEGDNEDLVRQVVGDISLLIEQQAA